MANGTQHEFLTPKEAAGIIRVSHHWFLSLLRQGLGPKYSKIGLKIRIPSDEFYTWARNGTPKPGKKPRRQQEPKCTP